MKLFSYLVPNDFHSGTKYKVEATIYIGYDMNDFTHYWEIKSIYTVNRNLTKAM